MKKILLFVFAILCMTYSYAQNKVTGTVTAKDDGLGIPGTSIMVKGTKIGTYADEQGKYTLNNVPSNAVLVFASIGFASQEVQVGGREVINVVLEPDAMSLDESIVVAYGTAKKGTYTGAASVVRKDAIKDVPTTSFENALNGKVAGLQVTQGSGQAGSTSSIRIRGIGSMNASNEPLYVVDGVPVIQGNVGQMSDYTYSTNNVMSTLNPDDIESITVLKDAAASALYGSRAANGVIVITTKRGREGRPVVSFKTAISISPSWAYNNYEVASVQDNVAMMYEIFYDYANTPRAEGGLGRDEAAATEYAVGRVNNNNGPTAKRFGYLISADGTGRYTKLNITPMDEADFVGASKRAGKYFDWEDALFRTGVMQNYDLSVSGGNDQSTYYSSLAYTHDKGRSLKNSFTRVSGRVNLNQKVGRYFEFATNVNLARTKNKGFNDTRNTGSNSFMQSRNLLWGTYWPYNYEKDAQGNLIEVPYTSRYQSLAYNILHYKDLWDAYSRSLKIQASETITAHILPELDLRSVFSYDNTEVLDHYYVNAEHYNGGTDKGSVSDITTNYNKIVSSTTLNYNKVFAEKHTVGALLGFEAERNKTDFMRATGTFLPGSMNVVSVAGSKDANGYNWGSSLVSVFSRLEYNYDNLYYASASFRRDGSSKLGESNRWGNFWSVAASWRLGNESFIKDNLTFVSNLRLRASYGVNGTLPTDNYGWRSLSRVTSRYQGNPGSALYSIADPDLTWETNYTTNIALEFGLLEQRIYGTIEWFNRDSKNLLQDVPIPDVTGYSETLRNIGKMNNRGWEIEIGGDIIRNRDWKWDASLTASFIKSKVKKLYEGQDIVWYDPTGGDSRAKYIYREGESTLSFYGREWGGVNPQNGRQVWFVNPSTPEKENDIKSEIAANSEDYFMYKNRYATYDYELAEEKILANAIPKLYGGLNTNLSWKGITLGLNFIYRFGSKIYDGAEKDVDDDGYYWSRTRSKRVAKNRWTKEGQVTNIPLLRGIDLEDAMVKSSRHIHSGNFIRLKTITLGYNLPKTWLDKVGIQNTRIYCSGTNLLTWAQFKEVDPEVNNYYTRGWEIPFSKVVTFGVELTF